MKFLVVIDMQNDFIDGSLGTPEAEAIVENVCRKIGSDEWDKIFVTQDTHEDNYLDTYEGKNLPVPHCIRGMAGWLLNASVRKMLSNKNYQMIEKPTFGTTQIASSIKMQAIESKGDFSIEVVGLCTDICVISNVLMLRAAYPNVPIIIDASCCAGVTPEKHKAALEVMKSCQITVIGE